MNDKIDKNLQKEFSEFVSDEIFASESLDDSFEKIRKRIFPNPFRVFVKIAFLHFLFGFLSLGVCNQFGLNPFGTSFSLSNWFMQFGGHKFCMSLCGVVFMSSTYIGANFFLSLEELESVWRYKWLETSVFCMASLAAFYFFGAELVLIFVTLWFLGALVSGVLAIELSYYLRRAV